MNLMIWIGIIPCVRSIFRIEAIVSAENRPYEKVRDHLYKMYSLTEIFTSSFRKKQPLFSGFFWDFDILCPEYPDKKEQEIGKFAVKLEKRAALCYILGMYYINSAY